MPVIKGQMVQYSSDDILVSGCLGNNHQHVGGIFHHWAFGFIYTLDVEDIGFDVYFTDSWRIYSSAIGT